MAKVKKGSGQERGNGGNEGNLQDRQKVMAGLLVEADRMADRMIELCGWQITLCRGFKAKVATLTGQSPGGRPGKKSPSKKGARRRKQ